MPITRTYYKVHRVFPDPDYFYLENISGETLNFACFKHGTPTSTDLSYSLDKVTWDPIPNDGYIRNVVSGGKVWFRSSTGLNKDDDNYYYFNASDSFNAGGHIATLFNYLNVSSFTTIPNYGCYSLFKDSRVVHANIDFYGVNTIGSYGCKTMFINSNRMVTIPDFSTIENIMYGGCANMFVRCTSLTTPADLTNVKSVGGEGCRYMYSNCSSLTEAIAPNIASWNTTYTFGDWLSGTASTGVVRKPAGLTIPTNTNDGIPTGWTTEDY